MRGAVAVGLLVTALGAVPAAGAQGVGPAPSGAEGLDEPARLERLVRQDCGSCHGMTLRGGLGPAIDARALSGRDAAAIAAVILDGIPGTAMPPWRPLLTEEEARWIAEYLLGAK